MAQKRIPVLEDFSWQLPIKKATTVTPPTLVNGERYLVPAGATGAWAGQDSKIAWADATTWHFDAPAVGWVVFLIYTDPTLNNVIYFDGTDWRDFSSLFGGDYLPQLPGAVEDYIPQWDADGVALKEGKILRATVRPDGTADDISLVTEKAVRDAIEAVLAASDAMVFVGTIAADGLISSPKYPEADGKYFGTGASGTKVTDYSAGWTFKAIADIPTSISDFPEALEAGDMVIAINDDIDSSFDLADFFAVQANVDGAVTNTSGGTDGNIVIFDGGTGRVIKDSGLSLTDITDHLADDTIHFLEGDIDHNNIQNIGVYKHVGVDEHINTRALHRQTYYVAPLKSIVWDDAEVVPTQVN